MVKKFRLNRMVEEIDREFDKEFPLDSNVRKALLEIDRELFVINGFKHLAYKLDALPMQSEQWISSPATVAKMTHHLELRGADSVLEVGCGSGYQAAILSKIVRRVFTIERIEPLLIEARERFKALGINNIFTRYDDGQRGWKEYAPFDRIIFSATADKIPQVLFDQLAEGGVLIAPVNQRGGNQIIMRYTKKNGTIDQGEAIESCLFVPVLNGTKR